MEGKMTREEAIHILELLLNPLLPMAKEEMYTSDEYDEVLRMAIEALKEHKTGKWIAKSNITPYYTEWWYECSECCQKPLRDGYGQEALSDYCPNCGCKMEYTEEDDDRRAIDDLTYNILYEPTYNQEDGSL